jgi:hypothetical protein
MWQTPAQLGEGEPELNILGINAYHGDACAALIVDGDVVCRRGGTVHPNQARHLVSPPRYPVLPGGQQHPAAGPRPHRPIPKPYRQRGPTPRLRAREPGRSEVAPARAANLRRILRARTTLAEGLGIPRLRLRAKAHFIDHHLAHPSPSRSLPLHSTGLPSSRSTGSGTWSRRCGAWAREPGSGSWAR